MPRVVDSEERTKTISEIAWRIAGEEGLAAVTYRRVAAEMNASTAVVTHAFPSRESLLQEVFRLHVDEWLRDLDELVHRYDDPVQRLRMLLLSSCPVTPEAVNDARVWIATMARPDDRTEWLSITRGFGKTFTEELTRTLASLGADTGLAFPLGALVWGLNAAAVEDPERWTEDRVRWSIDVMLEALGLASASGSGTTRGG